MDLIVHIGLPKTGSTTLQERLFMTLPEYLGVRTNKNEKDDFGKQFSDLVPRESKFSINDEKIR